MTATEELRRMLDERGVEWTVPDESWNQDSITYWKVGSIKWVAFESENDTLWLNCNSVTDLTPEQAIAATLGAGSCHDKNGFDRQVGFECMACGTMVDSYMVTPLDTGHEVQFRYCPFCGGKVVSE